MRSRNLKTFKKYIYTVIHSSVVAKYPGGVFLLVGKSQFPNT